MHVRVILCTKKDSSTKNNKITEFSENMVFESTNIQHLTLLRFKHGVRYCKVSVFSLGLF